MPSFRFTRLFKADYRGIRVCFLGRAFLYITALVDLKGQLGFGAVTPTATVFHYALKTP